MSFGPPPLHRVTGGSPLPPIPEYEVISTKPLPVRSMLGRTVYCLCIHYFDDFHVGQYQSLLYLLRDENGMNRVYFVNEKGYGSDIHGVWSCCDAPGGNVNICISFHCLGSRGIAMHGARNLTFQVLPRVFYRINGELMQCTKLRCIAPAESVGRVHGIVVN